VVMSVRAIAPTRDGGSAACACAPWCRHGDTAARQTWHDAVVHAHSTRLTPRAWDGRLGGRGRAAGARGGVVLLATSGPCRASR
jgi:hypothetical protein